MKLSELLNKVKVIQVIGNAESKEILNITIDSRKAGKNNIFFALIGLNTDGHKFVQEAINQSAEAVVVQNMDVVPDQVFAHAGCVKIVVEDTRKALAEFSNIFYGEPSKKLKLIGITGTKGKSTTAFFVKNIFENAGYKCGLIGTIANYIGDVEFETSLTTPQAHEINYLLNEMVKAGCSFCVMEVSSIALRMNRVDNLSFTSAIFTNITSDHMDYHKTFEHYFDSKKILFDMVNVNGVIAFNNDDKNGNSIVKDSKARKISYGKNEQSDLKVSNIDFNLEGTKFNLTWKENIYHAETNLVGHFNALNAAAAFAIAIINGLTPKQVIEGVKTTPQVPGRFEVIGKKNKKVIVDYAHTSDSLKQALIAVHHIVKNERKVYTVFGCGGDRDKTKRPIMGEVASSMSECVYVTSDNPRTENPFIIIDEILKGIKANNYRVHEDREVAIRAAIYESEDDAVILIAGKGHENYQIIKGVNKHFSDKELANKYLSEWAN